MRRSRVLIGSYYYGPVYGYPWYGLPVYVWRGPHDHGPGNRVENLVATQKALALAKANGTPVARSTATVAPAKPSPAAKPAPPAPPAKSKTSPSSTVSTGVEYTRGQERH